MTINQAQAQWGLKANATPTGTNVANDVQVGVSATQQAFTDCDIAYSFKVTATGATDTATLDLDTGSVSQTAGTPTITDGDGKDFEGVTLPTLVTFYGLLVSVPAANTANMSFAASDPSNLTATCFLPLGKAAQVLYNAEWGVTTGTMSVNLFAIGDVAEIVVLGKTT